MSRHVLLQRPGRQKRACFARTRARNVGGDAEPAAIDAKESVERELAEAAVEGTPDRARRPDVHFSGAGALECLRSLSTVFTAVVLLR